MQSQLGTDPGPSFSGILPGPGSQQRHHVFAFPGLMYRREGLSTCGIRFQKPGEAPLSSLCFFLPPLWSEIPQVHYYASFGSKCKCVWIGALGGLRHFCVLHALGLLVPPFSHLNNGRFPLLMLRGACGNQIRLVTPRALCKSQLFPLP